MEAPLRSDGRLYRLHLGDPVDGKRRWSLRESGASVVATGRLFEEGDRVVVDSGELPEVARMAIVGLAKAGAVRVPGEEPRVLEGEPFTRSADATLALGAQAATAAPEPIEMSDYQPPNVEVPMRSTLVDVPEDAEEEDDDDRDTTDDGR